MASTINADVTNGLVLTPDTSGEIKLQAGGADIATVSSTGIAMAAGKTLPASALTGSLPAGMGGKILQVVSNFVTATATYTTPGAGGGEVSLSILNTSITPSSTSSKIIYIGTVSGEFHYDATFRLYRDSTYLSPTKSDYWKGTFMGPVEGDHATTPITQTFTFVDSPSTTSSVTYGLRHIKSVAGAVSANVNRPNNAIGTGNEESCSHIMLLEVAG